MHSDGEILHAALRSFAAHGFDSMSLRSLNTELGFLYPHAKRDDLGKFTQEGRYRVWKEIWMLNYLGRSARYE